MAKRDIYIAIMVAAAKGRSVHLSADEVYDLSNDDAIATRAANGLAADEWTGDGLHTEPKTWASINPYRHRTAANIARGDQ